MTTDHLTRRDISRSLTEDPSVALLAISPRAITEHSSYTLRSMQRDDYPSQVALGQIPAWERALAMVAAFVPWLRAVHVGWFPAEAVPEFTRCAYVPPREEAVKETERVVPHADIAGYVYDPSWVNGGIAAHNPDRSPTPIGVRERAVHGIAAFRSVEAVGGIPEIAWFYCGAAFELGMSSSFDGMLTTLLNGGSMGDASCGTCPKGPGDLARLAAGDHRRILSMLAALAHRHQRDLRLAYTDQRYPRQLVHVYGVGVAALVWRAMQDAGELTPGTGTLERLVASVRVDWPTYEAGARGKNEALEGRIRRAAELQLWTAHEHFRVAAAPPPGSRKPPKRRRLKQRPDLSAAGLKGRKRRQLVEVPRRAA